MPTQQQKKPEEITMDSLRESPTLDLATPSESSKSGTGVIDSILPEWIIGEERSPAFQRINNMPVFRPGPWKILDKTTNEKPAYRNCH